LYRSDGRKELPGRGGQYVVTATLVIDHYSGVNIGDGQTMGVLQVPDLVVQSSGELIGVLSGRGDVNQFVHVVDGDVVGIRFGWETDGWSSINLWVTGC